MNNLPTVLLPYQCKWQEDTATVRVAEKSRRIGFSWNVACEVVLQAAEIDGCDAYYTCYNKESTAEFIRDCATWAKKFSLVCSDVVEGEEVFEDGDDAKAVLTYTIRFASGFRVVALSSRPTNLRNKRGHIIIDEAAHHEDLKGLLKAAMAILMWGGKARVSVISTHDGVQNDFNKLVEEIRAGEKPYSLHRVTIDDAIAQGLVERIYLVNGEPWDESKNAEWRAARFAEYGDDADEELRCIPASSGGVYLPQPLIERQQRDGPVYVLHLPPNFVTQPEEYRVSHVAQWCKGLDESLAAINVGPQVNDPPQQFAGLDFGRTSDRSVLTPGYLTASLRRRFPFAVEMLNVPYEQQKQVVFYVLDKLQRFIHGAFDATGNGEFLAEVAMQRYGADRITCVKLTEPWYASNLPPFKAAFEKETIEVVRHADHLADLGAFRVIDGIPKLPKTKTKASKKGAPKRHGDAAIAYVLGHFASRMPAREYDYKSAPTSRTIKAGFRNRKQGIM